MNKVEVLNSRDNLATLATESVKELTAVVDGDRIFASSISVKRGLICFTRIDNSGRGLGEYRYKPEQVEHVYISIF